MDKVMHLQFNREKEKNTSEDSLQTQITIQTQLQIREIIHLMACIMKAKDLK